MHEEASAFLNDTAKVRGFLYACANRIDYRKTGVFDADDLVHEGWLAIWQAAPSWKPVREAGKRSGRFSSFAYSVARHAMLAALPGMTANLQRRWYYRVRRGKEAPDQPMEMNGLTQSMVTIGVRDEKVVRRVAMMDAMDALRRLPPRDARIVIDRFYFGRSQREIGARYGLAQNQVSKILKRALGRNPGRAACDDPKWTRDTFVNRPTKRPMRMTVVEEEAT